MQSNLKIGELLVKEKLIDSDKLNIALQEQKLYPHQKLGSILVRMGYIEENIFLNFLASHLQVPYIELNHYKINIEVIKKMPEIFARRYRALALSFVDNEYIVGMADPLDVVAQDEISRKLGAPIRIAVVRESDLLQAMDESYRHGGKIQHFAEELVDQVKKDHIDDEELTEISDSPVAKLLNSIFEDAVRMHASDIHIEAEENGVRIRKRVDGYLQEYNMYDRNILASITSRLKLMAKMNISEKRHPQDGRMSIKIQDRKIDVRVSTLPLAHGESIVMRLLDQEQGIMTLDQIGMTKPLLEIVRSRLELNQGMILVTGPTGSGKSTTLYAALHEVDEITRKIITVEDPIEYTMPMVNQVQVMHKIGLDFATILRAALRQDPDVVMLGEIRDLETAQIALQGAMTGHLVLSTLHTNDAVSAAERLIHMGLEPFMVAYSLKVIIAQRLARKVCQSCSTSYQPNKVELASLNHLLGVNAEGMHFVKGVGCVRCGQTGYKGRIGVHELLSLDDELAFYLGMNDRANFRKKAMERPHYRRLPLWALDLACQGMTTLDEVFLLLTHHSEDSFR